MSPKTKALSEAEEKRQFRIQCINAGLYGWITLASLWALAGGQSELLWGRLPFLSLLLAVGTGTAVSLQRKLNVLLPGWKMQARNVRAGVGLGLIAGLLTVGLLIALKAAPAGEGFLGTLRRSSFFPGSAPLFSVLVIVLLVSPLLEFSTHALFQPVWGRFGSAFLESLTLGFGLQNFSVFAVSLGWGYLGSYLVERRGFQTAFVFRCVWVLVLCAFLYLEAL